MNSNSILHTKWCLVIDDTEVAMPTKEHAVRLGHYLRTFNVPLHLTEVTIPIEKKDGKVHIGDKTRTDVSELMDSFQPPED